jgi:hypothetical protein
VKDKHIIDILENAPLADLTESESTLIRTHVEGCATCHRAYQAAQLSALLIKERTAEAIDPSPFFHTRVMAAWREQQAVERAPVLGRLWKSAGAFVSSLAVTTAALAAFSFLAPSSGTTTLQDAAVALNPYSAEAVVLDQNQSEDQMTYEQVLSTIYANDNEAK